VPIRGRRRKPSYPCTCTVSNVQCIAVIRHAKRVTETRHCASSAKKPKLDPDDLNSYRPISNLTFTSKLVVYVSLRGSSSTSTIIRCSPRFNRPSIVRFHSTETAIAALHNDLIRAADADQVTALVLLDLSSAFDTVDHDLLLPVPKRRFGIDGVALLWFQSYLPISWTGRGRSW